MTWLAAGRLALAHWKTIGIALALAFGVHSCRARDAAIATAAAQAVRDSVSADSLRQALAANEAALSSAQMQLIAAQSRVDTVTRQVTRLIERVRWDTVTLADGTVSVPPQQIATADSTIRACGQLVSACANERIAWGVKEVAYRDRIKLLEERPISAPAPAPMSFRARAGWTALGGILGYLGGRVDERRRHPP